MPYPPTGLNAHREMLAANQSRFIEDKERAVKNWVEHAWKCARTTTTRMSKKQATPHLREMALLVWEAQGGVPLFNFGRDGAIPCWNRPQDGLKDYIRYEIGHMDPTSNGGSSKPENLCFQSARCNQHIQSSLHMDEVVAYYFQTNNEVLERLKSLQRLHNSKGWASLRKLVFGQQAAPLTFP